MLCFRWFGGDEEFGVGRKLFLNVDHYVHSALFRFPGSGYRSGLFVWHCDGVKTSLLQGF